MAFSVYQDGLTSNPLTFNFTLYDVEQVMKLNGVPESIIKWQ